MASFISALALFILVLSNVCFTLPILDEKVFSSTYSSVNDDVTTGETFNLRLVVEDETSGLPNIDIKRSIDEHVGYEVSTFSDELSENKFARALRSFDEYSTSEPMTITTENSNPDKPEYDYTTVEPTIFTTEQSPNEKREFDDFSFKTIEPTNQVAEVDRRSIVNEFENDTQKMQVELTTNDMLSFTSTSVVPEFHTSESSTFTSSSSSVVPKVYTTESSTSTSSSIAPTVYTPESSTYTSSSVAPKVYTSESSTSTSSSSSVVPKVYTPKSSTSTTTSTEKYIGHLKDESEQEEEYEHEETTKSMKIQRKSSRKSLASSSRKSLVSSTRKSKVYVEDKPEEKEEDPKESPVPIAVFDQQALDKVSNIPNDFLILDENNDLVVTGLPNKIFTTTMAHKIEEEEKPLNQGSTLLLFLLAALLFCACVLASTLAFVKNRHTLKRKSRITEMEAHLDQHYPYPFMFHQHHEKK